MSAETQQVQARLRYRGHRYNCDFRPGDNSVALLARLNAIRDFLRVQPEIQNEVFSVPDFEFVWHAALISVKDYPTSNGVINIESQRIKAPAFPAGNFRWHRSNIPRYQYFAEVFLFLRRRYSLITVPNVAEARQILSQPCDLHWKMCEYAAHPWFCLVLGPRLDFFAQTGTFQRRLQRPFAYQALGHTFCSVTGQPMYLAWELDTKVDQSRPYCIAVELGRASTDESVDGGGVQRTAEVLRDDRFSFPRIFWAPELFAKNYGLKPQNYDIDIAKFGIGEAVLATAAATTASEPTFYSTDVQPAANSTARSRRLAESAQKWPSAIPASILLAHAKEYHEQFHQCLQPPRLCGICACPIWDMTFELLDFRAPPCDLAQLHPLLSGTLFLKEFANYATLDVPPAFRGLTPQRLQEFFVPDVWLLHLAPDAQETWKIATFDPTASLQCLACVPCARSFRKASPTLPPSALANNNLCLPAPEELQSLSFGEQLFIARGFAVRRLRTLTPSGDPEARQQGMLGTTSAIAFPQNAATIFSQLPVSAAQVSDYLSVFFTDALQSNLHFSKEFVVRRSAVHRALLWLTQHNPYYADITIDMSSLQDLPANGVPPAWAALAQVSQESLTREFGPVDASTAGGTDSAIHAAVLDPGVDHTDPLQLWNTALLACERYERHATSNAVSAAADVHVVQYALRSLASSSNHRSFEQDLIHQTRPAQSKEKLYVVVPHADEPLNSYDPFFWTACFPLQFPYGDGIDGQPRRTYLSDHDWGKLLLLRRDRPLQLHPRKDLDFISVLFSVLHRRRLLRAVRIRVQAPHFREQLPSFANLQATDWTQVASTVGEHGSIPDALRSHDIPNAMKAILRCLQAVQGQIPCTDAARRMMRGELTSLITYFGCPSLFVTFNPADVLHPFTWRRGLTTPPTPLPQVQLDQHLLCALRDANLWRMVALDPTAAVEAFHLHVNTFLSTLLKVVPSAQQLPTDGIASIDGQGIFGPLSDPHVLVQNFAAQLPLLEERLWAWINSIVVTSFEAIPPMFDLPRSTLENLRPLPYSDAQMKLMHPHYRPHLVAASDHWFAADPNNFLYAHDFIDCPFALDMPVQKPFVPWCLDYLATTIAPLHTDTASMLLYDLRASVLYSGLLHCCQPKTCYKGKIGKSMDHKARARSTLSKLLMSCQRRIHKSVQEMISYLLGYPEAYSTHSFHKLYFYHLAARLESSEPFDGSHLASVEAATPSSVLIFPEESIQACSDTNNHFRQPQFYTPSSDDYPFRGDDLQGWPLYFYAAGVTRIPTSKTTFKTPGNIPFLPQHPRATSLRQQVLTATAWKIPHLMGPRIPPVTEDANKRGLLLLLLFKPWVDLHQLLPSSVGCASWSEAFDTWFAGLLASLPSPSTRASPLSAEYWAQRTLHIINHIDNMGLSDPTTADRELLCNPDELHGVPDTTTVEHGPPPGQLDSDSDVSCDQTYDIDYGDLDPHDFPDEPPFPKTETTVFDRITAWIQDGRCSNSVGAINLKQAAYLLLVGTGKTFITNCAADLLHFFLPSSTLQAAFTHRAARLVAGQTLHAALALPFDFSTASASAISSLGSQKDALIRLWHKVTTFFIDEVSMISNEILAFIDLRCRQIFNLHTTPWGGLALRLDGDFHQLPPIGASCLINPPRATQPDASTPTSASSPSLMHAAAGAALWRSISAVLILEESHRCRGPLQQLLQDLLSDQGISHESCQHLHHRLLQTADARMFQPKFHPSTCTVGVMRHTIRVCKTMQRAQQAAQSAGHRLVLAVAADRSSFGNRNVTLDPTLAQEAAAVHTLSATANLPGFLALYPGVQLCLETKLCPELGVVRGCTVIIDDIVLADIEPSFPRDPTLPPHPLLYLPQALLLRDDYWIACFVLLSRVQNIDDVLLLRLPDFTALNKPRPEHLRSAYNMFRTKEHTTLQQLDNILRGYNLQYLRDTVTLPLLASHQPARPAPKLVRRARR
ncbi:unnamed protein product [Cladocopium goreaui]|uniref:ATP-dependent DNA helicase n=1 Tax=Cladocopium goreaui TaxID=2562237 RepID=A0A9P1D1Q9_9DINO|nr:unnamed protein product [Cladocopium goreaui]